MGVLELILTSIGLAMDAFAVSVCKGLSMKKIEIKKLLIIGAYFGGFQALMPLIGYFCTNLFKEQVTSFSYIIAFILLTLIGAKMIKEAFDNDGENCNDKVDFKTMIVLAIATSIDALAVGITFSLLEVKIINAITLIFIITTLLSFIGVKLGNKIGNKLNNIAKILGGIILIIIGIKILINHLT